MRNTSLNIDIIVPTYNRPSDIKKYIEEIEKQTYSNFKVFIIDDCSNENISHLVPENTRQYKYEKLEKNSGQAFARNFGVSLTKGDILIFMDDDAWFLNENALQQVVDYFNLEINLGGLMFDIKEPNRKWLHERHNLIDNQEIGEFIACGCAFRKSEFLKTSGFREEFHSYGEETDLTLQLIKNGSKIKFGEKIKVYHNYNPGERSIEWIKRFKFNSVRNDLIIVLSRFPFFFILPFFFSKVLSHIYFSFRNEKRFFISFIQIIKGASAAVFMFRLKARSSLSISQFTHWLKIRF